MAQRVSRGLPRRINEHELRAHAALVACALLVLAALSLFGAGTPAAFRKPTFPDFAQFYAGARMLTAGKAALLYVPREFLRAIAVSVPWPQETLFPPVYPVHVYAAFRPLTALPYGAAALAFTACSIVAYVGAIRLLASPDRVPVTLRWLALANPALLHVVMSGQLSTVALATLALAWCSWRDGHMFRLGLFLGSLAWKPQLLLFGLIAFAVRPGLRLAAGGAVAMALHAALFTAVGGASAWASYGRVLAMVSSSPGIFSKTHQLQSLKGALELLAPRGPLTSVALAVLTLGALALAIYIGRRSCDRRHGFAAIVLCGLLVSPHVYVYDGLLASAALFPLAQSALSRGFHSRADTVAYLLYWSPLLLPFSEVLRIQFSTVLALLWLTAAAREAAGNDNESDELD